MDDLLRRRTRHKKTDVMTYIFLSCYVLILFAGFPAAVSSGGFALVAMYITAFILLLGVLIAAVRDGSKILTRIKSEDPKVAKRAYIR
ncbi:MAG: hypothetical protein GX434_17720 [Peptococcaceae bacterium]|nr:hypothetical protein [Peptococcaceae bacterium]